jgi:pyruvate/2-oxoglutarate dehydrogenase complex dihydrolipoamide acyltransferase (E2) component
MPAMSPTMTEGNISSWKVKEGDSFSTGDVLLEIETDKATMDVEAQEDGIMAKIIQADGTKSVQVGSRIAVLAEPGDDISSLEIPSEESKPPQKQATKEEEPKSETSGPSEAAPPKTSEAPESPSSPKLPCGRGQNTKYPFYPAVTALIHENHISESDIPKIPATGPNGRLLKGDVLSYLGRIQADYSSTQSKRIEHLAHMDLSNIKIAPPAEKKTSPTPITASLPEIPAETSISLSISLTEVLKVQKRIQDTLAVSIPLSTFLARAVDIANDDLPKPNGAKPSLDDLFNAVLGLDSIPTTSRGGYIPQITALPSSSTGLTAGPAPKSRSSRTGKKEPDIIDILSGHASLKATRKPAERRSSMGIAASASIGAMNLFSVTVPMGEEKRARTFLERVKTVLQVEPGRLVL